MMAAPPGASRSPSWRSQMAGNQSSPHRPSGSRGPRCRGGAHPGWPTPGATSRTAICEDVRTVLDLPTEAGAQSGGEGAALPAGGVAPTGARVYGHMLGFSRRQSPEGGRTSPTPLFSTAALQQIRYWSRAQWSVTLGVFAAAFIVIGLVGQTLPWTSQGRTYPVEWWNYATLIAAPALMGLIAGTFVGTRDRRSSRAGGVAGTGVGGAAAAIVMACPVCSPLAIPLLGVGGGLSFLTPQRGVIALLSTAILAATLLLRLRAATTCAVPTPRSQTTAT